MSRPPGFVFMFGVEGADVRPATVDLLRDTGACGVALLGRNIESPQQVKALIDGYERALDRRLLWAVDHEGGWVVRFKRGLTAFPGNMALGHAASRWPEAPSLVGRVMGTQLRACGIDINFAPVVDVTTPDHSPAVTIRSFGNSARRAGECGAAMIRAMQSGGVHATAKHWPGKGAARQDAHVTLPTVDDPFDVLHEREFVPFAAAVKAGVSLVMSTHVAYRALHGPQPLAATFSSRAVAILRQELEFDGALITDDLGMGAILERGTIPDAAVRAARAGHDILLIAGTEDAQRKSHAAYAGAWSGGAAWERSVERIERLMSRPSPGPAEDGEELSVRIARAAVRIERDPMGVLPLRGGSAVVVPSFETLTDRYAFEESMGAAAAYVRSRVPCEVIEVPVEPEEDAVPELAQRLVGRTCALFSFDALRYEGQRRLLTALQAACPRFVLVPVRNPWDATLCRRETAIVHPWGFRAANLAAACEAMAGRRA